MTDAFPSLAELAAEEEEMQLASFTNDDAWALGSALVATAREQGAPVAITLLYAASDKFHQTFIEGRHGSPLDVAIDASGILIAYGLATRRRGTRAGRRPRAGGPPPAAARRR